MTSFSWETKVPFTSHRPVNKRPGQLPATAARLVARMHPCCVGTDTLYAVGAK